MDMHRIISGKAPAPGVLGVVCAVALSACGGGGGSGSMSGSNLMTTPSSQEFADTALVSNKVGVVATTTTIDANLQNPWGIAVAPGQPFWIADNNSNLSTLYTGTGTVETSTITGSNSVGIAIPASAAGVLANPTGQVYNATGGFLIHTVSGM